MGGIYIFMCVCLPFFSTSCKLNKQWRLSSSKSLMVCLRRDSHFPILDHVHVHVHARPKWARDLVRGGGTARSYSGMNGVVLPDMGLYQVVKNERK